jgi:isochorismate synthase
MGTTRSAVCDFIEDALARLSGQPIIAVISVPAPYAPMRAFLRAVPRDHGFVWNSPPSGTDCAGGGVAHRIEVSGRDRLRQLRQESESLWTRVREWQHPRAAPRPPRLVGGLSFSAGSSKRAPWAEFGDGAFTLARWTYWRTGRDCTLSLAIACDGVDPAGRRRVLDELDGILGALDAAGEAAQEWPDQHPRQRPVEARQLPVDRWEEHILKIREAIAAGEFLKIVAGRRCDLTLESPADDVDVLGRLMSEAKCTHFAFRRTTSSFVGASPEILFLKIGRALRTQALAGTLRRAGAGQTAHDGQCQSLLASKKDRSEHEFVVEAIRKALAPLCSEMTVAEAPEVIALRNILHINTPFEARVRPATHVTDLLEALHPTPAVGGVPGPAARDWIVQHEPEPRGWYTGPVGWFDCHGNAEFAVAIRCGVVAGANAVLYTGAGVVLDSEPSAEYAETALKQLPMLRALGVELG